MPSFNELEEISTDINGKTKRLNKQQLESIEREGFVSWHICNQYIIKKIYFNIK